MVLSGSTIVARESSDLTVSPKQSSARSGAGIQAVVPERRNATVPSIPTSSACHSAQLRAADAGDGARTPNAAARKAADKGTRASRRGQRR